MIDINVIGLGFTKSEANVNLYHIVVDGKILIIVLYVNDLMLIGVEQLIKSCKEDLAREFEMKDMELLHYFLGLEIWKRDGACNSGKLCQGYSEEFPYGWKQTHGDSSWRKLEEGGCYFR